VRILFDNIIYSLQTAGGISVVWSELLGRALNDSEIDASFIEYENKNIFRRDINIPNNRIVSNSNSVIPKFINRYFSPKSKNEYELFHSSYYRINRNANIKSITTIHDFTYEYFNKGFRKYVHSRQKEYAINNSNCIICVSKNTKKDLLSLYPQVDQAKIEVVHNGVSSEFHEIHGKDNNQLASLVRFSMSTFALYIGDRKSEYKNFRTAVSACATVRVPLVMVGGGVLTRGEINMLTNLMGSNNYQHLLGIDNKKLNILYNFALCLVYPSSYEGFGIPIIEAQKCGCLVIASRSSSIPEVAGNGAILIKNVTNDSLSSVLMDAKRDKQFILDIKGEGYMNASKYSWEKCYDQTKQIYSKLIASTDKN
jgi:glycosyltransferase involved in cell wall biosynthesis